MLNLEVNKKEHKIILIQRIAREYCKFKLLAMTISKISVEIACNVTTIVLNYVKFVN